MRRGDRLLLFVYSNGLILSYIPRYTHTVHHQDPHTRKPLRREKLRCVHIWVRVMGICRIAWTNKTPLGLKSNGIYFKVKKNVFDFAQFCSNLIHFDFLINTFRSTNKKHTLSIIGNPQFRLKCERNLRFEAQKLLIISDLRLESCLPSCYESLIIHIFFLYKQLGC